jgi:hypothetical protein
MNCLCKIEGGRHSTLQSVLNRNLFIGYLSTFLLPQATQR